MNHWQLPRKLNYRITLCVKLYHRHELDTREEARIPDACCLCNKRNDISNKSQEANEAAAALVEELNSVEGSKCAQLKLDTIISAKVGNVYCHRVASV